ncbi:hypothetical protein V5N11_010331 [Cardamine amara subsp. amara]|uniref:Myb/SANT-like domain-containing protein n=1 Tax=Cardamine amara subsp. amara TaxID=228776 RepID=A0ABD0ZIC3_CARAN
MTNYTLKDPTPIDREYMVEKFNLAFNMNINYGFFKNKLDEFKKAYKRWKELMKCTGISVDPETSMIYASEEWWNARELGCKITTKFKRQPPEYWDVMQRCFVLDDVSSQPQNSSRQRKEEMMKEGLDDDAIHGYSDNDGGDMHQTQVPETEEDEEVYCVSVNDDTHPSNEFVHDTFRVPDRRAEQRNRVNSQSTVWRGNSSHRSGGSSGTNVGSVVQEEIIEDNLLRQLYKILSLAIKSSNDKVCNNFGRVVLTKKIMMNSKRQKQYSLPCNFQRKLNSIGHA